MLDARDEFSSFWFGVQVEGFGSRVWRVVSRGFKGFGRVWVVRVFWWVGGGLAGCGSLGFLIRCCNTGVQG